MHWMLCQRRRATGPSLFTFHKPPGPRVLMCPTLIQSTSCVGKDCYCSVRIMTSFDGYDHMIMTGLLLLCSWLVWWPVRLCAQQVFGSWIFSSVSFAPKWWLPYHHMKSQHVNYDKTLWGMSLKDQCFCFHDILNVKQTKNARKKPSSNAFWVFPQKSGLTISMNYTVKMRTILI